MLSLCELREQRPQNNGENREQDRAEALKWTQAGARELNSSALHNHPGFEIDLKWQGPIVRTLPLCCILPIQPLEGNP